MNERHLIKLEKQIRGLMLKIKNGEAKPSETEIGKKMNLLKKHDEALFETLIVEYKEILLQQ